MSQPGKQYAFYIHHSHGDRTGVAFRSFVVDPGKPTASASRSRSHPAGIGPNGSNRSSGSVVGTETFAHPGGVRTMTPPVAYTIDIALRIKATR